jgi:hypothetical protein
MNLEQTLEKIVEHAHEELRIVRKRAEEKTAARDHGEDYHEAQTAAIDWTITHTWSVGYMMLNTKMGGGTRVLMRTANST